MKKLLAILFIILFLMGAAGMTGCEVDNGYIDEPIDDPMEDLDY